MGRVEPHRHQVAALSGPLPEGARGHPEVQEPRRGFPPLPEEAQEDTQGCDQDGRREGPRREAEGEGEARGEGGCARLVVLLLEGEELRQAPEAPEEGEGHALHLPRGGRSGGLEQQRGREGAEAERSHQEDNLREPVGRGSPCPRRAHERQGDVHPQAGELLRLFNGLPEQTYFRTITLYEKSRTTRKASPGGVEKYPDTAT